MATLPSPIEPVGTSAGEVTPRYNLRPFIARWVDDLKGEGILSRGKLRPTSPDVQNGTDNSFTSPPSVRTRSNKRTRSPTPTDVIAPITPKGRGKGAKDVASARKIITLQNTNATLRATIKKLEKSEASSKAAFTKVSAERDVAQALAASAKEREKDKKSSMDTFAELSDVISECHARTSAQLDKLINKVSQLKTCKFNYFYYA